MKNIIKLLLIGTSVILFSCKPDANSVQIKNSDVKKEQKKTKNKSNSPIIDKAYWAAAKKETGVGPIQASEIRKITAKYNKQIADLRKNNKWEGVVNQRTRKTINKAKEDELKKLLAKKYVKYTQFKLKWADKNK